jgi:uncharacterized MAPEG superfamily protein
MSELVCLEIGVVLWLAHVLIQAGLGSVELPFGYLFTARDAPAQAKGVMFGRATRALANYVENFAPFVALDLGLMVTNHPGGFGPTLWIICRILYIPLYLFAVTYGRTAIWALSLVGLVMMFFKLAF